jgi:FAD/FMN-containing dehydrogenase
MTGFAAPRTGMTEAALSRKLAPMTMPSSVFLSAAKALLGPSGWSDDPGVLAAASTPWRGGWAGETPFLARPSSTAEAAALIRLCAEHHVAITPQGGNTGLVDGGIPHGEICISTQRMQILRGVDALNNSLTIEAGAPLVKVHDAAQSVDRLFPLSLGSEGTATIGGLISTNAGGVAVLRYGMMRDLILGLEVVLPSGDIWHGLSGLRKNNTGYDLKHLFAGAEGTLGLITAATLKLFPRVQQAAAWAVCETSEDVVQLLAHMQAAVGDSITSFEIIPANAIQMVMADLPDTRDPLPSDAAWRALIEISMSEEARAAEMLETALASAMERGLVQDAALARSESSKRAFWHIRESIPLSKRAYGNSVNQDISVPVSRIPAFIEACNAAVLAHLPGAEFVIFGHVGDGNLHYSVCESAAASVQRLKDETAVINQIIYNNTMQFGGSISAEHGVGRLKRDELITRRDPAATATMRAIKQALDPQNIFNPGRVIA